MKYRDEARHLWQTYVPGHGQAGTVQGELIRAVERLRWEAKNNGNGNWGEQRDANPNFIRFCDYLEEVLPVTPPFDAAAVREIRADIARLRDFLNPRVEDDVYDRLVDRVVEFHRFHGRPIPREHDPRQQY